MEIIAAKSAGFCPGVKRAVEGAANVTGDTVAHLGPIVHNDYVVDYFKNTGVRIIERAADARPGETVVIRAHGIPPSEEKILQEKGCVVIDYTCPFVSKIHDIVKEAKDRGDGVIIVGNPAHPEIIGIAGAADNTALAAQTIEDLQALLAKIPEREKRERQFVAVIQTTFVREMAEAILEEAQKQIAKLLIFDTICYTTARRQEEAVRLAAKVDLLLVLGSSTSANTAKLLELALAQDREAHLIQRPDQVPALLEGRDLRNMRIGITAGASTPERMIREVIQRMTDQEKQVSEMQQNDELVERTKTDNDVAPLEPVTEEEAREGVDVKATIEENEQRAEGETGEKLTADAERELETEAQAPVEKAEADAEEAEEEAEREEAEEEVQEPMTPAPSSEPKKPEAKEEKKNDDINFEDFIDSIPTLKTGTIVTGRLIRYDDDYVYVDVKDKSEGKVPRHEFTGDMNFDLDEAVAEHRETDVYVRSIRNSDMGKEIMLSKAKVDFAKHKEQIEEAYKNKIPVTITVTNVVRDGVIGSFGSVDLYIHRTQLDHKIVENLEEWRGKTFEVLVTQFDTGRRRLRVSGSRRALIARERRKKAKELWENIEVGQEYDGVVRNLTHFGAFVDIGGVDGLVHITELSWDRIKHPSEVVQVGDVLRVRVLDFDKERKRISLGFKRPENDPFYQVEERFPVGTIVRGIVVRMFPFGAFVEIAPGVDALCHISQISNYRLNRPEDVLTEGMEVDARVLDVSNEERKISISIKEVEPIDPPEEMREQLQQQQQRRRGGGRRRRRDDRQREERSSDYIDKSAGSTLAGLANITVKSEEGEKVAGQIEKQREEEAEKARKAEEEKIAKEKAEREAQKKAEEEAKAKEEAEQKAKEEAEAQAAAEAEEAKEEAAEEAPEADAEEAQADAEEPEAEEQEAEPASEEA